LQQADNRHILSLLQPSAEPVMLKILRLLVLLALVLTALTPNPGRADSHEVAVLTVSGTITPVLADYIERGIDEAEASNATAVIVQLDTPGGLDSTMRDIVQLFDGAALPIVVYVTPGARAASAGYFITSAADVAAMAPDTAIGAATPVSLGEGGEQELSEELKAKILNDAIAYARAIAEAHGRNVDWAEEAVRHGSSIAASEALELGVIDLIATSLPDLIAQLDGLSVTKINGISYTIRTGSAEIKEINMTPVEAFLLAISDPNIAFLLLSLASLGLMVEILNPGLIFPGTVGAISGLLAFYSLGVLPVDLTGILFIVLAFALFVVEVFTPTFGLLTAGGLGSLIFGSIILFQGGGPLFEVNIGLVITVAVIIAAFFAFVINRVIIAHRRQATTGREELIGKTVTVRTPLEPQGTVFHEGEIWQAELDEGRAAPGEEVVITRAEGLKLFVTRIK